MIDVTFLLLIFFMVSSTMQGTPDADVPVARNGVGVSTASALVVRITNDGDAPEPTVTLENAGGAAVGLDELPGIVEQLRTEIDSVVLKADGDVPEGFVQRVARAVGRVEGLRFYVGVRESPGR